MRARQRSARAPERVNYLASVSDLMSALLFVFVLALAVAIIQAKLAADRAADQAEQAKAATIQAQAATLQAQNAPRNLERVQARLAAVETRLAGTREATKGLLVHLQEELAKQNIRVDVDVAKSVLRVPETAVTFEVGKSQLDEENIERVRSIGRVLAEELICYQAAVSPEQAERCAKINPYGHTLDAVFIEGHTDNQRYRGDETGSRNRFLSTARSNAVYGVMVVENDIFLKLKNRSDETLFSLSGYGAERPLPGHWHAEPTNDPANRRIEFRFLMTPPEISREESDLIRTSSENLS